MSREEKLRELAEQEQALMREIYGFDNGVAWERERIIKLLEGYQAKKCNDYECFSGLNRNAHDWECGVDEMNRNIALIKGEK